MKKSRTAGRAAGNSSTAERSALQLRFSRKPQAVILFPAHYSAAVANLGYLAIWERLNSKEGFSCDRAVWDPRSGKEPRGVQTNLPLSAFPLIFVSSSFELDLIAVIDALLTAGIEPLAKNRRQSDPLIVAGGVSPSLNPAPWAPFIDLAILGEGEEAIMEWLQIYLDWLALKGSRPELKAESSRLPYVFLPDFPERTVIPAEYAKYAEDPACSSVVHLQGHFGDCWLVEITRGCPHRCRFCAVCGLYSARFADEQAVLDKIERMNALNAPKIGLVGAAAGDYPGLKSLVGHIIQSGREITISSLRIERADEELLQLLAAGGLRTLTVAPEAGGEGLRRHLGKKSSDDDLVELLKAAGRAGLRRVRLYFLIGLPEPEPPQALIALVHRLHKEAPRSLKLDLRVSSFIPKPGTPWETAPFAPVKDLNGIKSQLRSAFGNMPRVSIRFESTRSERLAALLSRGDRKLGEALLKARRAGRPLEQELRLSGIDPANLLEPASSPQLFPWHFIHHHP